MRITRRCLFIQIIGLLYLFWPGVAVHAAMKTYHAACALGSLIDYQDKQALFDQCAADAIVRYSGPPWYLSWSMPYTVIYDSCTTLMSPAVPDKGCSFKLKLTGGGGVEFMATQCYYPGSIAYWNSPCPTSCPPDRPLDPATGECASYLEVISQKNLGPCPEGTCPVGNPINPATGNKFQIEVDYSGAGAFPLAFERTYNSHNATFQARLGPRWRHSYDRSVQRIDVHKAEVRRQDGKVSRFTGSNGIWVADPDVVERLEELRDSTGQTLGWHYTAKDDSREEYDASGRLVATTRRDGLTQTLDYDVAAIDGGDGNPDTLDMVTDPAGKSLSLTYDANRRVATLTDPAGEAYLYQYSTAGNLIRVIYPDATPGNGADNPTRIYHYEDTAHPHALTGITDENGDRFASWAYDTAGRAILSEHAGGAERVEIVYNPDGSATITDSLGAVRTQQFTVLHGVVKTTQTDGEPCANCGLYQNTTYDANGFDARGLETARTEAVGTAEERTITTQWHPVFRLPTQITAPGQITTFTYDAAGRLLTREVIAQ